MMNRWCAADFFNGLRRSVLLGVCLAHGVTAAQTPEAPVPDEDPVVQGAVEAIALLDANNLAFSAEATRRSVIEAVLRSVDPFAVILDREAALRQEREAVGLHGDVGLMISVSNGVAVVTGIRDEASAIWSPKPTGPPVGLGDQIVEIDGASVSNRDVIAVTRLLRGDEGTSVSLGIQRAGQTGVETVTLERQRVQLPAIAERREFPNDLCYLRLHGLYAGAGEEALSILREWAAAQCAGAVLDLRGAGGSDLDSAGALAGLVGEPRSFLFSLRDARDRELRVQRAEPGPALGMPLVVLVDEQTTRAAELLAATLKGSGRGVILVGRTTAGDMEVRERIRLANGEWAYVAVRKLVVGNGSEYRGARGIEPHIRVLPDAPAYADVSTSTPSFLLTDRRQTTEEERRMEALREHTRGDPMLTRAVDILLGLRALNLHGYGRRPSN